ncbi:sensor histidine kinase [Kiloniella sp. b19]|uniref:sensor histidine kinase n=1 Tax=Kiloniella sp. GXU_MW_B19 TaxID=3141326 RepID=UPI0031CDF2AE
MSDRMVRDAASPNAGPSGGEGHSEAGGGSGAFRGTAAQSSVAGGSATQQPSGRSSIRRRLLLLCLVALAFLSGLMLLEMRESARVGANNAYDRVLLGSALAISDRVLVVDGALEVDIPFVAFEMLTSTAEDRVFYEIYTQDGAFLTGYDDLPDPPRRLLQSLLRQDQENIFYDAVYKGEKIRVALVSRFIAAPDFSTRYFVKVSETTLAREQLIASMVQEAVLRQMTLVLVAGALFWFGIGWGLKPLSRLKEALQRRSPDDLRPIEHKVPGEVQHLVDGINDLMARLESSITAMRSFTSNAAHQLRTPLSVIRTQTELALQSSQQDTPEGRQGAGQSDLDKRLRYLVQATDQSTRLVNQLLSLATATNGRSGDLERERLDLRDLASEVTGAFVPRALERSIDLGLENCDQPCPVQVNSPLIVEALGNLLDNALNYCPAGSRVTVRLHSGENGITLEVEDNGPGLAPELRGKVFERFERTGQTDSVGCGLGLPIVQEIMSRHGGQVTLHEAPGGGCLFRLTLDRAADDAIPEETVSGGGEAGQD